MKSSSKAFVSNLVIVHDNSEPPFVLNLLPRTCVAKVVKTFGYNAYAIETLDEFRYKCA